MASALSVQILCPVCLTALREPVCLPCEHSYCRVCITRHLAVSGDECTCPECRRPISRDDIRVHRTLGNIVDAARAHLEEHDALRARTLVIQGGRDQNSTDRCPEHFEVFRLFCETDQKPICVVCREDRRHREHSCTTLSDAFQTKKEIAAEKLESLFTDNEKLVDLIESQADEIIKTREKARTLSDRISEQFEQMHQFLRDKEEQVKAQLLAEEESCLEIMEGNLFMMGEMLSEGRVNQGMLMSALETDDPCQFLQLKEASQACYRIISSLSNGKHVSPKSEQEILSLLLIRSPVEDIGVTRDSLFLGPYETHLQFFVWKEMLTFVQPVPHHHAVEVKGNQSMKVTPSGLSVQCRKDSLIRNKHDSPWMKTESSFSTGQLYWELEVGKKLDWEIGICSCELGKDSKDTMLCFNADLGYHIQQTGRPDRRTVHVSSRPRRIGVYLDCDRKQVSFYNADSMTIIDTVMYVKTTCAHTLCLCPGQYLRGKNSDPLTVCWY